jgi:hypothetical protein
MAQRLLGFAEIEMCLPDVLKSHMYLCHGDSLATDERRPHGIASGGQRVQPHVILPFRVIQVFAKVGRRPACDNWQAA